MTDNQQRKRGRPRGATLQQIARALPRMQVKLLKKALDGDVEAIKACHQLIGKKSFDKVVSKHTAQSGKEIEDETTTSHE